jgi:hypothetical protein
MPLLVTAARVDRSGRIHDNRLIKALGWLPGRTLDITAFAGLILISAGTALDHRIDRRGAIALPSRRTPCLHHRCRRHGHPVGRPAGSDQTLVVYTVATAARLLLTHRGMGWERKPHEDRESCM